MGAPRHGEHRGPGTADEGPVRRPAPAQGRHATQDAAAQLLDTVTYRPVRVPPARRTSGPFSITVQLLVAGVLGVVTVTAVGSLRVPQPSDVSARGLLVEQIEERTAAVEALTSGNRAIDEEIATLQNELLRASDRALVTQLEQSALLSGTSAVAGPGLVVELDDPDAPEGTLSHESRVQDIDIQIVVNHLRAAGAEAIAVDGHRLTALSAIRSAGEAIWVDLSPLSPPYRIEAIGDVRTMQAQFARSPGAAHLSLLVSTYGISATTRTADELRLPGGSAPTLRYATATSVPDGVAGVTSSDPDEGTS